MHLTLKETVVFSTGLSGSQVADRLNALTEPATRRVYLEGRTSRVPYRGTLDGSRFHLVKNTGGERSAFYPRISGYIHPGEGDTRIEVQLKAKQTIWVGLIIWCGILGMGVLKIGSAMVQNNGFVPSILILFGLMLSAYIVALLGFQIEGSARTKQDLKEIFQGQIVDAP